ncbi:uncharacterized protein LOC105835230 [Monomorium pharaonis]|uniref:uncharacterized protein LOC105835230 n=1 Tax=Monomorium pharaonis TaxID=307658 RepID=UPI0017464002|nr:uncharacterized protein LOC105835230 [Monomorium pharaonis]
MQDLWHLKTDWDESLPIDLYTKWKRYEAELPYLKDLSLPRPVIALDDFIIWNFTALQTLASQHTVPSLSIPRLELCAALLLTQLSDKILKCLTHEAQALFLWTDSTIILAWLQACSRLWTPFVANRAGEIHQLTNIQNWHHIRSQDNPADLLSRGIMPMSLQHSSNWWSGPSWLSLNQEEWPHFPYDITKENIPERKSTAIATIAISEPFLDFVKRLKINSTEELQASYNKAEPILSDETEHASKVIIKVIQKTHFREEIESLATHQAIHKNSTVLRLNPFLDEFGILRVSGNLKFSDLPYDAKHQILLPGHYPFSRLIINYEHERHLHAGPQATLAAVRQKYWLVSARDVVRQITRAERELKELAMMLNIQDNQHKIINYMSVKQIRWHFIPPRASHHGGLWEAAVKNTKCHLLRVTKNAQLRQGY